MRLTLFFIVFLSACSDSKQVLTPSKRIQDPTTLVKRLNVELPPLVKRLLDQEHIPGAAVIVVKDGRTMFRRGFGVRDVRSNDAVDPETTIFRIGSVSKPMTAWALARLIDQGLVELDQPVSHFVPELVDVPNISGSSDPILIRHLLTHTAGFDQVGIGRQIGDFDHSLPERLAQRPSLKAFLLKNNLRRASAPGQHYRYDTYGITLIGLVLEVVTGRPYGEAMRETLFEPLGLQSAGVALEHAGGANMAVGHGWLEREQTFAVAPFEVYVTQPASSVEMSASDMAKLMEEATNPQKQSSAAFSAAGRQALLSRQYFPHEDFAGVTYGMNEYSHAGGHEGPRVRGIGHGGSMLGYQSNLMFLPDHNIGIFVVANRNAEAGGGRVTLDRQVIRRIAEIVAGPTGLGSYPVPSMSEVELSPYAGRYVYGTFCHTCTEEEFEQGGWRPSTFLDVKIEGRALRVRDLHYLPEGNNGVFVSEDGRRKLYFARDHNGRAQTVSFASSPDTFERISQ